MAHFNARMYAAALAYYGLPPSYTRVFTSIAVESDGGKVQSLLVACDAARESLHSKAVWVQINVPHENAAITRKGRPKKACNKDIACIANVTLDFEYPQAPWWAHAVGIQLAATLEQAGLAFPGLPVEDSGGGCHLVLPLVPIEITEETAHSWNKAVALVVQRDIKPAFAHLVSLLQIEMDLEGFDMSRVLSVPGTWRPTNPQKQDCDALRDGYMRSWLPPYGEGYYPVRRESSVLTARIRAAYDEVTHPLVSPHTLPRALSKEGISGPNPSTTDDDLTIIHL